jgi:hypothetical protein
MQETCKKKVGESCVWFKVLILPFFLFCFLLGSAPITNTAQHCNNTDMKIRAPQSRKKRKRKATDKPTVSKLRLAIPSRPSNMEEK